MQNAYGGIVNIAFIVVFLTIVSGFLAFSVAYNKAFRVKNKIINEIEINEGLTEDAKKNIKSYMATIGFSSAALNEWNPENFQKNECSNGYCAQKITVTSANAKEARGAKVYYKVATAVSVDMPILNKLLPNIKMFQVSGTTSSFYEN